MGPFNLDDFIATVIYLIFWFFVIYMIVLFFRYLKRIEKGQKEINEKINMMINIIEKDKKL